MRKTCRRRWRAEVASHGVCTASDDRRNQDCIDDVHHAVAASKSATVTVAVPLIMTVPSMMEMVTS